MEKRKVSSLPSAEELSAAVALSLGIRATRESGGCPKGLFDDYPERFNKVMLGVGEDLHSWLEKRMKSEREVEA